MLLVVWVGLLKFMKYLYLFKASFVPDYNISLDFIRNQKQQDVHRLLMSNYLNGNFLACFTYFSVENSSADNICEHAFAKRREHLISSTIKLLTQYNLVVAFGVSSRV